MTRQILISSNPGDIVVTVNYPLAKNIVFAATCPPEEAHSLDTMLHEAAEYLNQLMNPQPPPELDYDIPF